MDVASQRSRARAISPVPSGNSFRQLAHSGDIELEAANVDPSQAAPNANVELNLTIRETAEYITPADPALCHTGSFLNPDGLTAEVEINPSWTTASHRSICIPVHAIRDGREDITIEFTAPSLPPDSSSQVHTVNLGITQPGLDQDTHAVQFEVTVGGFDGPQDPGNGENGENGGGGGGFLPCFLDLNASCQSSEALAWMGLAAFVLAASALS